MIITTTKILVALFVLVLVVCLLFTARYMLGSGQIANDQEVRLTKIPERYVTDFGLLLKDFHEKRVTADEALSILILKVVENDGVFLPLYETDTRFDYYFVNKERRKEIETAPKFYQQKSLRK
jgi:uncharacterized protein YecA (UPF0149 family)